MHQTNFTRPSSPVRVAETNSSLAESRRPSAADGPPAPHAGNIPLTCFYWHAHTACPAGERHCHFVHGNSDRIAERAIHVQSLETGDTRRPKYSDPTMVCYHWGKVGHCYHGDTGCWFAHWWPNNDKWVMYLHNDKTRRQWAGKPDGWERQQSTKFARTCRFWLEDNCRNPECKYMHQVSDSITGHAQRPMIDIVAYKSPKTCPFWRNGACRKSEKECRFRHEMTDEVAQPPSTKGTLEILSSQLILY
jgi:hypothetical protein